MGERKSKKSESDMGRDKNSIYAIGEKDKVKIEKRDSVCISERDV